jgi:putative addiction module component (TIGR02574 family)
MIFETIPQLQHLTPEEKLILSNELWADAQDSLHLGKEIDFALVAKLRQRLREYEENPTDVVSWEEIKARHAERRDSDGGS